MARRGPFRPFKALLASLGAGAALVLGTLVAPGPVALAHPLGNFTVNRYARVEVTPQEGTDRGRALRLRYVVDLAEIPTFQALPTIDVNGDGTISQAEGDAFARRTAEASLPGLALTVDGRPVPLRIVSSEASFLPGQAGLQTALVGVWLEATDASALGLGTTGAGTAGAGTAGAAVELRDLNDAGRVGWREMLVRAPGLPGRDVSDELRAYPDDLLQSPLDVRRVGFRVLPGGAVALDSAPAGGQSGTRAGQGAGGASSRLAGAGAGGSSLSRAPSELAALLTETALTPPVVALALLTAMLLGGMHALSPGHGKTVVGAYLVGSRGTARHALFLGLTVTLVHTAGVFALGLATLFVSRSFMPERVFPWLSLVSGLLVLGMGLSLLRVRLRALRRPALAAGPDHGPDHGPEAEGLTHSHGLGSHTHAVPGADGAPVTWRSLLALGISGGLLPCPSALVVMLGAIALERVLLGLVLIVAFSAGLAATLAAIGLAMVYSGRLAGRLATRLRLDERGGGRGAGATVWRVWRAIPAFSAGVVALAGLALTAEAAGALDLFAGLTLAPPPGSTLTALSAGLAGAAGLVWLRSRRPVAVAAGALAHAHGHGDAHGHSHAHDAHAHDAHAHDDHGHGHDHAHAPDEHAHGHGHEDHGHAHDAHGHSHERPAAVVGSSGSGGRGRL